MIIQYVLIEFDENIFDNFKDEIQVYSHKYHEAFDDMTKIGIVYQGYSRRDWSYHNYTKDELYMAIPVYLYETFSNLIRIERQYEDWKI